MKLLFASIVLRLLGFFSKIESTHVNENGRKLMSEPTPTSTLSLEQQFSVASFDAQVDQMSVDQLREMCKLMYKANLEQKNTYCELLKHQWGIESGTDKRPTT